MPSHHHREGGRSSHEIYQAAEDFRLNEMVTGSVDAVVDKWAKEKADKNLFLEEDAEKLVGNLGTSVSKKTLSENHDVFFFYFLDKVEQGLGRPLTMEEELLLESNYKEKIYGE